MSTDRRLRAHYFDVNTRKNMISPAIYIRDANREYIRRVIWWIVVVVLVVRAGVPIHITLGG
ncbi:hypothetical protein [Microtetraspora malaysiensis]|uniref:Uncharacterized protein n=1 Tax=Microtetraspora malaysiensis TaxID=161358 RepID=A0ABW6SKF2_9ACTN